MSDAIFAFGQRGTYHFETQSKWRFGRLPSKLETLFSTTSDSKIGSCYHVALGAGDSFFISYKSKDGRDRIHGEGLPSSLETWLYAKNAEDEFLRDFPKLRVTLGPYNESFFATDGLATWWLNLPAGLLDAFKSNRCDGGTGPFTDMPRLVALGVGGDYFMLTEKKAACWSLGNYRTLRQLINQTKDSEAGLSNIQTLYLHPYRLQTCVIQNKSGQVGGENLPPHTEEAFDSIKIAVQEDTEKLEAEKMLQATLRTQRLLAQAQAIEEQNALQRQLLLLRRQREAEEQAILRRQQAQLMQLNQTINMINAMNLGMMMGNFGFGGNSF